MNTNFIKTVEKVYRTDIPNGVNFVLYSYIITDKNYKKYIVPLDEANTDYKAIQEWISNGGEVIDNPPTE